jgi:peptidoglycan/xylan/chitin deacetylase (PgdA/CDA1 family)
MNSSIVKKETNTQKDFAYMELKSVKNHWRKYLLFILLFSGIALRAQTKIIIKLDDLEAKQSSIDACIPTFEYLANNGIKAGWGVMRFGSATESQIATLKNYAAKTNSKSEPLFEIWHHGLDHTKDNPAGTWEFSGTAYAYQKAHFDSASQILKNKLGVSVHTFGAPYNQTDATLLQVLSEATNMKVVLLGQQTPAPSTGIVNLSNRVNMESATGVVNYDYFVGNYNAKKSVYKDYMVLQGHPPQWTTDSLKNEFKKIVTFLTAEGCEFVTPYGYYCFVNNINPVAPVKKNPGATPRSLNLFQNYPNPFNPVTKVCYSLPEKSDVTLIIYDMLGREVVQLVRAVQSPADYSIDFDGTRLSSNAYLCQLTANNNVITRKMVLLK